MSDERIKAWLLDANYYISELNDNAYVNKTQLDNALKSLIGAIEELNELRKEQNK